MTHPSAKHLKAFPLQLRPLASCQNTTYLVTNNQHFMIFHAYTIIHSSMAKNMQLQSFSTEWFQKNKNDATISAPPSPNTRLGLISLWSGSTRRSEESNVNYIIDSCANPMSRVLQRTVSKECCGLWFSKCTFIVSTCSDLNMFIVLGNHAESCLPNITDLPLRPGRASLLSYFYIKKKN